MATGFDGAGKWALPEHLARPLPVERIDHSNSTIDIGKYKGKRVGILGNGSSAFDVAVAALEAGAARVDLCFRRKHLPITNPNRFLENDGLLHNYPELSDTTRWQMAKLLRTIDQPPAKTGFQLACSYSNFHLHANCQWQSSKLDADEVMVDTSQGEMRFDYLICATGLRGDLSERPELRSLLPHIALWSDIIPGADKEHAELAAYPYLGKHFELVAKSREHAPWLSRVFAFNTSARVSMGLIACSISGQKHMAPRLVRGVVRQLFLDQEADLINKIVGYDSDDLDVPAARRKEIGLL